SQAVLTVNVSTGTCKTITLGSTGTNNNGDLTFNASSQVTVSGTVRMGDNGNKTSTITMTAGGTLICQGLVVASSNSNFIEGSGTVALSATNTLPATIFTIFNNLTISAGTTTLGVAITVNGTVTINSGATLDESTRTMSLPAGTTVIVNGTLDFTSSTGLMQSTAGTTTLTMGASGLLKTADSGGLGPGPNTAPIPSLVNNGGTWNVTSLATNGTVEYYGGAQPVTDQNYNNLTLTNAGTKTWTIAATRTVNGTLTINTGAPFTLSGAPTLNVKGNWTNNSAATFTATGTTVNLNGTSAQTIGGTSPVVSFNNLTQSNSAGVILGVGVRVNGVLDLASGDITTGANTLTQGGTSSTSGAFDVVGNVNRGDVGATTRSFGNVNVQITRTAGTGVDVTVNLVKNASSLTGSVLREYGITQNGGTTITATLRLRYLDSELNGNSENTGTVCNLQLWKKTGTTWAAQGSTACDATGTTASWAELTPVVGFSQWTLKETGAPTACKLEGFQAARSDDGVVLQWRTGYEVNNVGFNVYRQGSHGEMVKLTKHMVAGSGLMVRKNTALTSGLSYYWSDPDTKKGDHPQYWLEDLDADGHTSWNGPFVINEAAIPTRPTLGAKAAPGEKGGRGDANSMTINSISEETEQSGA